MNKEQALKRLYDERYNLLQKHRLFSLSQADQQALEDITHQIDELEDVAPRYDVIDALFTRTAKLCFEIAYQTACDVSKKLNRIKSSERREAREKRLRELGFEEVSEEQKQRNLDLFDLYRTKNQQK